MIGLSQAQFEALSLIEQAGGAERRSRIKRRAVDADKVANSLEQKGLVIRARAGRDSPEYLRITDKGRATLAWNRGK
ncbi:hypothetical protein EN866_34300 [Mesorhizobium sp. M2D.F.Ca.ET.223.01.1.1]|uniref:hypothetical protein n=1 Tax=Mesorhizobium sp. M2D.F.Ca.ET.223.01.1.1 TaxID=2563940 RepID=UPI00109204E8|nr:hypothetical protein [Mesorhizobium sp. M2D.F.Ca.ET.223.01.1.1]TGR83322.1 hypothetical protein EN866_34300 [Mesorhizobium sp. M2D.F.Ca.ET.223.01.1.1]TGT63343.1 hypothetical protein EN802_33170 [bacterium M00.F.Ca.ET.159.01.1.1]TGT79151.1 hypothetical protein EN800_32515 [bacterium M00.F.Ca.ET.157.01.1.1]